MSLQAKASAGGWRTMSWAALAAGRTMASVWWRSAFMIHRAIASVSRC